MYVRVSMHVCVWHTHTHTHADFLCTLHHLCHSRMYIYLYGCPFFLAYLQEGNMMIIVSRMILYKRDMKRTLWLMMVIGDYVVAHIGPHIDCEIFWNLLCFLLNTIFLANIVKGLQKTRILVRLAFGAMIIWFSIHNQIVVEDSLCLPNSS